MAHSPTGAMTASVEDPPHPVSSPHGDDASIISNIRRNGKPFSCEPCRRGKLKCDHRTPVCGRCLHRKKQDQCVYHPAPLTKPRLSSSDNAIPTTGPVRTSSSPSVRYSTLPYPQTNGLMSPPLSYTPSVANPQRVNSLPSYRETPSSTAPSSVKRSPATTTANATPSEGEGRMSFREGRVGYLGSTSFSAVFRESGDLAAVDDTDHGSDLAPVPLDKIRQGAEVLALLRDIPIHLKFTERWFDLCDGIVIVQPVYRIWVDELWREFGPLLVEGDPDQLRMLSELVWRNTRQRMKLHGKMSYESWARSNTGRNLRWEVVGIILCMSGITAVSLSDWDSILDVLRESYPSRSTFVERMYKASECCLCFCYECETLNDLYVSFLIKDLVLVECIKGDAHYAAWQRTGEICDAVVAMGLHQGNKADAHTPFWLAEHRKKLFISAYSRDKSTATFLGRPPRLSHRYCKLEVPLDLSDEELFKEGPELEAVLLSLDDNGWNTSGNLHRTTWLRVWYQHWRIREDILEIALGSEGHDISSRARRIREDLLVLHDTFPEFMKVDPEAAFKMNSRQLVQMVGPYGRAAKDKTQKHVTALFTIYVRLGVLYTELLLLRALVNRKQAEYQDLIPVSRQILSIVLLALSHREFFQDFWLDLTYMLASHGIPSAGVLAIELLKQEQSKQYTPDILPRSEIIQDISVLISGLGSVGPCDGNFFICDQGRRSLRKVLDQILNPHPTPVTTSVEGQPLFEEMNLSFPTGNDADFLQWLENVEWDKAMNQVPS